MAAWFAEDLSYPTRGEFTVFLSVASAGNSPLTTHSPATGVMEIAQKSA